MRHIYAYLPTWRGYMSSREFNEQYRSGARIMAFRNERHFVEASKRGFMGTIRH